MQPLFSVGKFLVDTIGVKPLVTGAALIAGTVICKCWGRRKVTAVTPTAVTPTATGTSIGPAQPVIHDGDDTHRIWADSPTAAASGRVAREIIITKREKDLKVLEASDGIEKADRAKVTDLSVTIKSLRKFTKDQKQRLIKLFPYRTNLYVKGGGEMSEWFWQPARGRHITSLDTRTTFKDDGFLLTEKEKEEGDKPSATPASTATTVAAASATATTDVKTPLSPTSTGAVQTAEKVETVKRIKIWNFTTKGSDAAIDELERIDLQTRSAIKHLNVTIHVSDLTKAQKMRLIALFPNRETIMSNRSDNLADWSWQPPKGKKLHFLDWNRNRVEAFLNNRGGWISEAAENDTK